MRQALSALRRRVGHRGAALLFFALLFFALLDFVYCISILASPPETRSSDSYRWIQEVLPLTAWATLWALVGLVCVVQAFMRLDRLAFALAAALKVGWGLVHVVGWVVGEVPRGYVSAAIWLAFAGFVQVISTWPEPGGGGER